MFGSGLIGSLDIFASSETTIFRYLFGVLAPDPTAVPPSATVYSPVEARFNASFDFEIATAYAANSSPSVTGSASIK